VWAIPGCGGAPPADPNTLDPNTVDPNDPNAAADAYSATITTP